MIEEVNDYSTKIDQYKAQEELLVVTHDKAMAANTLIGSKPQYNSVFRKLSNLLPQGVYFNDMRIADTKVVFSGKARTSADIASLVSAFVSADGARIMNTVSVDSLSSDELGNYSFVISARMIGGS